MTEILDKAKPLAQATGGSLRKDAVADWLGQPEFGFEPSK
jgi:hypothetical protein